MTRLWFAEPLETVATFWRLLRRDGVALGFSTHDRDLWFDGVRHRAAPGLVPAAIRRTAGLEADSAEVEGALGHDSITSTDIAAGRFDGTRVIVGLVDWVSGESFAVYHGTIGQISERDGTFQAALVSRKAELARDGVPRTSPSCRAAFCGPECGLSAARLTRRVEIAGVDPDEGVAILAGEAGAEAYAGGLLRWRDGPLAGTGSAIGAAAGNRLVLSGLLPQAVPPGTTAWLRQGCDRTLATCAGRFANAINFRGEPFLPGTDFLTRYPLAG